MEMQARGTVSAEATRKRWKIWMLRPSKHLMDLIGTSYPFATASNLCMKEKEQELTLLCTGNAYLNLSPASAPTSPTSTNASKSVNTNLPTTTASVHASRS